MPWVRFTADYNFTPTEDHRVSILYKAEQVRNVRKQCADKAVALGRAVRTVKPK